MSKLLFFSLLVVYTLTATLQVGDTSPAQPTQPQTQPIDVMIQIPVTDLKPHYQYIKQMVQFYIPGLQHWQLTQILKLNTPGGVVYYLYRYTTIDSANTTVTKDILVLEYRDGTFVVVDQLKIVGQTMKAPIDNNSSSGNNSMGQSSSNSGGANNKNAGGANTNSGQSNSQQTAPNNVQANNQRSPSVEVGGFSPTNTNNLDSIQIQAKNFVLASVPKLQSWDLINVRMQIVSGQNNCFTFQNPVDQVQEEYCVWSQPWNNNFMQLTLPDGSTVKSGGNP